MKPASAALEALLKTRQFYAADLYDFVLVDGTTLRYCSGDRSITDNGTLYPVGGEIGPFFDRTGNRATCHWSVGISTDSLMLDVMPGTATVLGVQFQSACRNGVFDGAEMTLRRAFMPTYGDTSTGSVTYFVGRVGDISIGRSVVTFTINSHMELLNIQMPRNIYSASCRHSLGDAGCAISLNAFSVGGVVSAGSTASTILVNFAAANAGYFDLGKVVFTTGVLKGVAMSIKSSAAGTPGVLQLLSPLASAPAAGDQFTMSPGCDKSLGTNGCPKFNNVINFGGEPYVPQPSTAV